MEIKKLVIFFPEKNTKQDAELVVEKFPLSYVQLSYNSFNSGKIVGSSVYEAMQILHRRLDMMKAKLLCNCFRYDVKVSSMSIDMGSGIIGYQITFGQQAQKTVDILDPTDDINAVVTFEEQQKYFLSYLDSLKK